jgi:uncharacterized protein YfcZ (UPF0381/DUF406 family)
MNHPVKNCNANKPTSELNSFASIRACRAIAERRRVIRGRSWLVGVLILSLFPSAFAQTDFSAFWKKFRSAVIAGDKASVAEMTKFPLSMPYEVKAVKNKEDFSRRYSEIFKGEANAAQCFASASAKPRKESARRCEIYCPFKDTPNDWENAPIRFIFEQTKDGWRFAGLDNVNE